MPILLTTIGILSLLVGIACILRILFAPFLHENEMPRLLFGAAFLTPFGIWSTVNAAIHYWPW